MFSFEFKEAAVVLFALAAGAVTVALLGVNFLDPPNRLDVWVRIGFAALGLGFLAAGLFTASRRRSESRAPSDPEATTPVIPLRAGAGEAKTTATEAQGPAGAAAATEAGGLRFARLTACPALWPDEVDVLELAVPCSHRERANGLGELAATPMRTAGFMDDTVRSFQIALGEAIANAFEHGCADGSCTVTLRVELASRYASFTAVNGQGPTFNLERALQAAEERLMGNPDAARGRGLLQIRDLCDRLSSVENGRGITGVFECPPVSYAVNRADNIVIATLTAGITNDALLKRTASLVAAHAAHDIVLDLSHWETGGSMTYTVALDAQRILARTGARVVMLLFPNKGQYHSPIRVRQDLVAYDVQTAFERLGRPELAEQAEEIIRKANERPHRTAS